MALTRALERSKTVKGDFFKGIMQWEVAVGSFQGKMPIFYYDYTTITAAYTASTKRVREYLPHPSMKPVEFRPGRCIVAFKAFEYRSTDIGPYNEFNINCPITFNNIQIPALTAIWQMLIKQRSTSYVWHLPVTTEIAKVAGIHFYGYPKFIADIEFHRSDGWIECTLSEEGTRILTFRGRELLTKQGKMVRVVTYSIKDGIPLVTNVNENNVQYAQSRDRKDVALDIGTTHPICDELNSIDLSVKPLIYLYSPVNEMILFAGRNLIDD